MNKGFTLIELIIVIVILGILSGIVVPQFAVTKERALDREAISVLGIIREAERAYRLEELTFYPAAGSLNSNVPADLTLINRELRLNLPANSPWRYNVASTGITTATRTGGPRIRTLTWNAANDAPTCCCAPNCFF